MLERIIGDIADYAPQALPLAHARLIMRSFLAPLDGEDRVPLRAALGRVLARAVVSPIDVPGEASSAMDGWAVRSQDLRADAEVALAEIGRAFAGRPFAGELGAAQCVRIMTGAVLPRGADTVVMQEAVRLDAGKVVIPAGERAGQNCRRAAEDMAAGQVALPAGTVLRPAAIGLAASLGLAELPVRPRLRVALFSSGDELTVLGGPLAPGQVYDSNRHALWAMLERLGCETVDLGVVRDDPAALEAALREGAARAHAVVTTGGAADGDADFTRQIAARLGEVVFWKLAVRPGRPFAFGRIGSGRIGSQAASAAFFGLPGNPVAAMVAFYRLVQPALRLMMGCRELDPPVLKARSLEAIRKRAGREEYQRGVLERGADGAPAVRLTGPQGSATVISMSEANCLVMLPRDLAEVKAGDMLDVILMDSLA
jgi:molybdopterin molybdotransferase